MLPFLVDRRGSVSTIAALSIGVMIALAGLVVHGSQLYVLKLREQRTADLAVQAAAGVIDPISNGVASAKAIAVAKNISEVNGFSRNSTTVSVANGNQLRVDVSRSYSTVFGATATKSAMVNSMSIAKPGRTAPPCVIGVTYGIGVSENSSLRAACGVISANNLMVAESSLNANSVAVGITRVEEEGWVHNAISVSPGLSDFVFSNAASDPVAGDPRIAALNAKLNQMSAGWPYAKDLPETLIYPNVPDGTDLTLDGNTRTIPAGARIGNLVVAGSTVRFLGSGSDPNCTKPTTVSGNTRISRASTLTLSSGCYVFRGDISLEDKSTSSFDLASGADVKIVVLGKIVNTNVGTLNFPAASYSLNGGLTNPFGGFLVFGDGPKVLGGLIENGNSILKLGGGPFYFQGATVRQGVGTINIGAGPTYIFYSSLTNGASGTMRFGAGPIYVVASSINNGDSIPGWPGMWFEGGPYYLSAATVNNFAGFMVVRDGNMELYGSSFNVKAGEFYFGLQGATSTGQVSMVYSTFAHDGGAAWLRAVTFAAKDSPIWFGGSVLEATAPSGSAPAYGVRSLLIYSTSSGMVFNIPSGAQQVSGVVYTPKGNIDFAGASYAPPGTCLALVGASVNLFRGASVSASACTDFPWPAAKPGPSRLMN